MLHDQLLRDPDTYEELKLKGLMYCITFRKP